MAVGTQVEQRRMPVTATRKGTRKWFAAIAIAIAAAGTGTGIFVATSGSDAGTPAVSSPEVRWVDPGVEARQDALKRYHEDNSSGVTFRQDAPPAQDDPQAALKRYHLDSK